MKKESSFSQYNYFLLQVLVVITMINQEMVRNWKNVALCLITLLLFILPNLIAKKNHIVLPEQLEIILYFFIFSANILGEIDNFYCVVEHWDTILHTVSGFLCAAIGFSLIHNRKYKLSPILITVIAISFSMTIGVMWEITEFTIDQYLLRDMQKDKIITEFKSMKLNPSKVKNINKTEIYLNNGEKIIIEDGYLDIGLKDTMKDLMVNFLGAIIFSILGYLYCKNKEDYGFIEKIIPQKIIEENVMI